MEPTLIKLRPPGRIEEMWVLEHFAQFGAKTRLAELFTDAKYRNYHPAVASKLADYMVTSVRDCLPQRSALRDVQKVIAIPSSKGLARQLAGGIADLLQLERPDRSDLWWNRPVPPVKVAPTAQRAGLVAGAMSAAPVIAETILLVDDAVQSYSTLQEASRAVRRAGAKRVVGIALIKV